MIFSIIITITIVIIAIIVTIFNLIPPPIPPLLFPSSRSSYVPGSVTHGRNWKLNIDFRAAS